jgi:hypothetical protein
MIIKLINLNFLYHYSYLFLIFSVKLKIKNLTNKKKSYSKFGATITKISNLKNEGW